MEMISFLVFYLLWMFLSIPIHEMGHMVFGLLSGYRFLMLRVFSLLWYKDGEKVRFKISRNRLVMGQCLMQPADDERQFRYMLYNLGGGLANILVAAALLALAASRGWGPLVSGVLISGIAANLVIGLMNLIPLSLGTPNDGMNAFTASRTPHAKHGLYIMLHTYNAFMKGMRYSDFDESMFQLPDDADTTNYLTAYVVMSEAARLFDMGRYTDSIECYNKLDMKQLQTYYKNSVYSDMIYYHVVYQGDNDAAAELYNKPGMARLLHSGAVSFLRILAAYEFFVNGDHARGRQLIQQAISAADNHSNKGVGIMEGDYARQLEKFMDETTE